MEQHREQYIFDPELGDFKLVVKEEKPDNDIVIDIPITEDW